MCEAGVIGQGVVGFGLNPNEERVTRGVSGKWSLASGMWNLEEEETEEGERIPRWWSPTPILL